MLFTQNFFFFFNNFNLSHPISSQSCLLCSRTASVSNMNAESCHSNQSKQRNGLDTVCWFTCTQYSTIFTKRTNSDHYNTTTIIFFLRPMEHSKVSSLLSTVKLFQGYVLPSAPAAHRHPESYCGLRQQ